SIAMYQDIHDRVRLTQVLLGAAQSAAALNDRATAQQRFRQALQTAAEMNAAFLLLPALAEVGNLLCHTGHHMQGVQLLHIVATHPACPHEQKTRVQQLLSIMDAPTNVFDPTVLDLVHVAHESQRRLIEPLSVPATTEPLVDRASGNELLSQREVELLRVLAHGLPNRDSALRLNISVNTVKTHLGNIYDKLLVHNRTQAINRARDLDLL
ncbi:MAG: LuxR C-terminal-related transcriptional regulator, partial [Chloroflexota bacterium]